MPFRTLDPDLADRLDAARARREVIQQQVRAGKRVRLVASERRKQHEAARPAYLAERQERRCKERLDAAEGSEFWAGFWLLAIVGGTPAAVFGAIALAIFRGPAWEYLALGVAMPVVAIAVFTISERRSQRRFDVFREGQESLPFQIWGAEATLGHDGLLTKMTAMIAPVGELDVDAVASLTALIAPEVRVDRSARTTVERRGEQVAIIRHFETYTREDGTLGDKDTGAPARWLLALLHLTQQLHDLHPVAAVEFTAS